RLFVTAEPVKTFSRLAGYLLVAIVFSNYTFNSELWKRMAVAFIFASLLTSISLIFEFFTGVNYFSNYDTQITMQGITRVRGPFGDPNASGAMVIPGTIFIMSIFIFRRI